LISLTKLSARSFQLEGQIQRFLVMDGALLVRIRQAFVDQAEIDASTFRCLDGV
jgi:hypothetical protein